MVVDKSYKVSAFGCFGDIMPNTDNMMFFLEKFKSEGLISSLIQEFGGAPNGESVNRIALMSNDGQTQVVIGTNRIDYSIAIQDGMRIKSEDLTSINKRVVNMFDIIFEKFNKKSNRLAINTESFFIKLTDKDIEDFMKKYSNPISLYSGILNEWNVHFMTRKNIKGFKNEDFNIITNILKARISQAINNKKEIYNGFVVQTDINTVAENRDLRFTSKDLSSFLNESNKLWNLIIDEMG